MTPPLTSMSLVCFLRLCYSDTWPPYHRVPIVVLLPEVLEQTLLFNSASFITRACPCPVFASPPFCSSSRRFCHRPLCYRHCCWAFGGCGRHIVVGGGADIGSDSQYPILSQLVQGGRQRFRLRRLRRRTGEAPRGIYRRCRKRDARYFGWYRNVAKIPIIAQTVWVVGGLSQVVSFRFG